MYIYVKSAGKTIDYTDWQGGSSVPPPLPSLSEWSKRLSEGDVAFAVLVGYHQGAWYVLYRNLLLPGVTDEIMGRAIVLNLCFAGLPSEASARALVLKYLDFQILTKKSGRPLGRFCKELAAAYKNSPDEQRGYKYDYRVAQEWAEQVIAETVPTLSSLSPTQALFYRVNPFHSEENARVKDFIRTHALRAKEGLRVLFGQIYVDKSLPTDVSLQYTTEVGTTEKRPFASSEPPFSSKETVDAPISVDVHEGFKKCCDWIKQNKSLVIGWAIVLSALWIISSPQKKTEEIAPDVRVEAPSADCIREIVRVACSDGAADTIVLRVDSVSPLKISAQKIKLGKHQAIDLTQYSTRIANDIQAQQKKGKHCNALFITIALDGSYTTEYRWLEKEVNDPVER